MIRGANYAYHGWVVAEIVDTKCGQAKKLKLNNVKKQPLDSRKARRTVTASRCSLGTKAIEDVVNNVD